MKRHPLIHVALLAAATLFILPPSGLAQFDQQKLDEARKKQAAQKAAIAKRRAAVAAGKPAPGAPAAPAPGVSAVYVSVTNNSQVTFRALVSGPDGKPVVVGEIPPSAQAGGPTQLESFPGQQWGFANPQGQIVANYVATTAAQQRYNLGAPGNAPQNAVGDVTVEITNHTGQTLTHQSLKPDGTAKTHTVGPTKKYTSQPGTQWVFSTPNGAVIQRYTVTAQKQQQLVIGTPQAAAGPNSPKAVRLKIQNRWGDTVFAKPRNREDVFNIEPKGGVLTSMAGTEWVFLNSNGKEIFAYSASGSPTQEVVLPTPAEWQGSIDRRWEDETKAKKATAAKQQRQQDFLRLINQGRQQQGLGPVKWSQKAADKAVQTYNPLGGGYSFAMAYRQNGPQSPAQALEFWMQEAWEKVSVFFSPTCTAVGYAEVEGQGVGFEYEPR